MADNSPLIAPGFWSAEEIEVLRVNYPRVGLQAVAAMLGRNAFTVRSKAQRMGLRCERGIAGYDNADLGKITGEQWAYLAGLIDGEGSIFILRQNPKSGAPLYGLEVTITNTSRPLIDWLLATFGGTERQSGGMAGRTRPQWAWVVRHHRAAPYLRGVLPHLVVKRRQATLALEFLKAKLEVPIGCRRTEEKSRQYEAFKIEMGRLNSRQGQE